LWAEDLGSSRDHQGQGRICQIRFKKKPIFRLDYQAYPGADGIPKLHYHIASDINVHRDLPEWIGGKGSTGIDE
jgi:hypothetical protein